jgi:Ca-activated chloride channel homolog
MQKITLLLLVLLCAISGFAQETTQGTLYAVNKKGSELGACPLKNTKVVTDISGFQARVIVVQEFENNFSEPIEAVYTFPLSQNGAVDEMTMKIGERIVRGKILKKEEARKVYERAKSAGQTASLLDQERPNIFTQSVANILPNEKIIIEISYVETLKYENGAYEFVFPMVVGQRYIQASMKRGDAENISPPISSIRAGHDISIEVNLNAGVPVEEIRSNSHEITTTNLSPNSAKISLANEKTIPNKDFVLRYDVIGKKMEDAVLVNKTAKGGFFNLILSPPERLSSEDITPKEIVFVLDTSGSMSGFPIEKAKESMKLALDGLYPNDTFNLITFAGETAILFDKPVPATSANLEKAQQFLARRSGSGGTEMMTAIKAALAPSGSQEHIRIVCFMTDGYVGNEAEIITEVKKHKNVRVFSFGIGDSVNRFLLDKIASEGRGEAEYVLLEDDGSRAAKRFHERIRNPYLTDIEIDWNGLPAAEIYPKRIPDLFGAKPVVIFGRYTKAASGTIKLKGKIGGQVFEREIVVNLPENEAANDALATLWARTKIDELMSQSWNTSENEAVPTLKIKNEITKLGLDYNLLTEFTSFVAVEERIVTNKAGKKIRVPIYSSIGADSEENAEGIGSGIGYGSGGGIGSGSGNGVGYGSGSPSLPNNSYSLRTVKLPMLPNSTKPISGGVINGKATNLPKPVFPAAARAVNASGAVSIQVIVDENGNIVSASAVSGHPLLRQAAEKAARNAKFSPTMISGQPVKITGIITYNFVTSGDTNIAVGKLSNEKVDEVPTAASIREQSLKEKLHFWLFEVVNRLAKNEQTLTPNETKFVRDGKAGIKINLLVKTPETIEMLKNIGFEIISEKDAKTISGGIAIEKLAELTEIAEVEYILPIID